MAETKNNDPDTVLVLEREYAASRELVFDAWTKAEHLEQWFGPIGFTTRAKVDFRVGGALSITLTGMGMVSTVTGVYREIVRPERIAMAMRFEDLPEHEMMQTVTFVVRGGKTALTMRQEFPPLDRLTAAQRDMMVPRLRGAPIGWGQTLQHLADYVAKRA